MSAEKRSCYHQPRGSTEKPPNATFAIKNMLTYQDRVALLAKAARVRIATVWFEAQSNTEGALDVASQSFDTESFNTDDVPPFIDVGSRSLSSSFAGLEVKERR